MNPNSIYPCGRVNRRGFLTQAGGGFFALPSARCGQRTENFPGAHLGPHFQPKAKSVIFLFMWWHQPHRYLRSEGQQIRRQTDRRHRLRRQCRPHEASGDPHTAYLQTVREIRNSGFRLVPECRRSDDEFAVVRSMWCNEGNHFPAVIETTTGHRGRQFDHPTLGSWVSYALGSEPESADLRQHRARFIAGSVDRWPTSARTSPPRRSTR